MAHTTSPWIVKVMIAPHQFVHFGGMQSSQNDFE